MATVTPDRPTDKQLRAHARAWADRPGDANMSYREVLDHFIEQVGIDVAMTRILQAPELSGVVAAPAEPEADATQEPGPLVRELVADAIRRFEEAKAFLLRCEQIPHDTKQLDPVAYREVDRGARDAFESCEAILAYQLERFVEDLAPLGRRVVTDEGEFEPFGVIRGGLGYIVRFDPGNMAPGIIGVVDMGRLVELPSEGLAS